MLPDWVSNPGPLTYESDALPIALRGPAWVELRFFFSAHCLMMFYIGIKFHENILDGIKVIEWTQISFEKFQRGIIL